MDFPINNVVVSLKSGTDQSRRIHLVPSLRVPVEFQGNLTFYMEKLGRKPRRFTKLLTPNGCGCRSNGDHLKFPTRFLNDYLPL